VVITPFSDKLYRNLLEEMIQNRQQAQAFGTRSAEQGMQGLIDHSAAEDAAIEGQMSRRHSTRDSHPRLVRLTRISAYLGGVVRRVSSCNYCLLTP
jgi:hypothetical protein